MSIESLNVCQMKALCRELHPQLMGSTLVRYISTYNKQRIFLILQKNEEQKTLLLCFQKPFLRFHLIQSMKIPKEEKAENLILKPLLGWHLTSIELINQDRILSVGFHLGKQDLYLIAEFFPKHPNYYVIDQNKKILSSLYSLSHDFYQPPPLPFIHETNPSSLSSKELESLYIKSENNYQFEQEKTRLLAHFKRRSQQFQHYQNKLNNQLKQASNWEKLQLEGEFLKANFHLLKRGLPSLTVWDWTANQERIIELNPLLTPAEEVTQRFRQSKKLQASLPHLHKQLEKYRTEEHSIQQLIHQLEQISSLEKIEEFKEQNKLSSSSIQIVKTSAKTPILPYYEYESATGLKIWVGKNARDNEKLTFNLSKGSDWWLHTQDFPGSHVIIRTPKGKEPDQETLLDALQLALHYSKAKTQGEAEICITQRKFVSRYGRNQLGKVQISKHRNCLTHLDQERYQRLKERKIPK